jgi:hypothetical protein
MLITSRPFLTLQVRAHTLPIFGRLSVSAGSILKRDPLASSEKNNSAIYGGKIKSIMLWL